MGAANLVKASATVLFESGAALVAACRDALAVGRAGDAAPHAAAVARRRSEARALIEAGARGVDGARAEREQRAQRKKNNSSHLCWSSWLSGSAGASAPSWRRRVHRELEKHLRSLSGKW